MRINDLSFAYGDKVIIDRLSFEMHRGELLCFRGQSGIGKTTLFRVLAGLAGTQPDELKSKRIAYLFQENRLLPHATALQNVMTVTDRANAEHLLEAVGLGGSMNMYPDEMSGGMQRAVAIARMLAYGGEVYLLDEPFTGLDDVSKARIIGVIKAHIGNAYAMMITHDDYTESQLADRVIELTESPIR